VLAAGGAVMYGRSRRPRGQDLSGARVDYIIGRSRRAATQIVHAPSTTTTTTTTTRTVYEWKAAAAAAAADLDAVGRAASRRRRRRLAAVGPFAPPDTCPSPRKLPPRTSAPVVRVKGWLGY